MLMHLRMIGWMLDVMTGNVEEAKKYAKLAHGKKFHNRAAADWCLEMSKQHLDFNIKGCMMLDQTCKELEQMGDHADLMAATKTMVHERREMIMEETAEVKLMIASYDHV